MIAPSADETPFRNEGPAPLVKRLSKSKAFSIEGTVAKEILRQHKIALVIAADTIVVSPDGRKILGKPESKNDARKMLQLLSGNIHTVYTGYCILRISQAEKSRYKVRVVQSRVKMRKLNKNVLESYVASGEPMDKAGAYGAQGLGAALIDRISGSYTNVVGLPMSQILQDLEDDFQFRTFSWF